MDAYAHMLAPGDTATVMVTSTVTDMLADGPEWGMAILSVPGSASMQVLLPERPGVRLFAGDLTPTLLSALERAIESLGVSGRDRDPEWVAPETLAEAEQYERALDALRGWYSDEEKSAAHRV